MRCRFCHLTGLRCESLPVNFPAEMRTCLPTYPTGKNGTRSERVGFNRAFEIYNVIGRVRLRSPARPENRTYLAFLCEGSS